jgi:hypothetical protein
MKQQLVYEAIFHVTPARLPRLASPRLACRHVCLPRLISPAAATVDTPRRPHLIVASCTPSAPIHPLCTACTACTACDLAALCCCHLAEAASCTCGNAIT